MHQVWDFHRPMQRPRSHAMDLPASGREGAGARRRQIRRWKQKRWAEIKKSPKRGAHHRLHRRKRTEREPAPLPHRGAAGTDAGAAISLQLEDAVGNGRDDVVELLLSVVSGGDPQPADHRVSLALAAARAIVGRVSSRLCTGTESVEYLWSHWKQHELPNFNPQNFGHLSSYARKALRRIRKRPTLVVAFWRQAELCPM